MNRRGLLCYCGISLAGFVRSAIVKLVQIGEVNEFMSMVEVGNAKMGERRGFMWRMTTVGERFVELLAKQVARSEAEAVLAC